MRRKAAFLLALTLILPSIVNAQPAAKPTESVTVTGIKPSEAAINQFIFDHTVPTYLVDKIARWKSPICPLTVGLGAAYAKFVTQHIREVAAKVGAPVNASADCKPNIRVVFTTKPQEMLDNVRKDHPLYLGYFNNRAQSARLATITRPIQAWYATATQDLNGSAQIDSGKSTGLTIDYIPPTGTGGSLSTAPSAAQMNLGNATTRNVTGNRLTDGLSSNFFNVLIAAEPAKLSNNEVGTLADYIAMLALSQPGSLESCAEFPTILNLLAPNCARIAISLTEGDLAYLRGLYKMTPDSTLFSQRSQIRYQMQQALK